MHLEQQFAGPLQDTIVQRWRDPVDGTVCYLYLPISAQHSPPTPSGFVQYGARPRPRLLAPRDPDQFNLLLTERPPTLGTPCCRTVRTSGGVSKWYPVLSNRP
jgi:hypothetical protein